MLKRGRTLMKSRCLPIVGCVAVLTIAACEIRTEIEIHSDGSGSMSLVLGATEEELGATPVGREQLELMRTRYEDDPAWEVSDYGANGTTGFRATLRFREAAEVFRRLSEIQEDAGEATGGGFRRFVIQQTDTGWLLDAESAPFPTGEFSPEDLQRLVDVQLWVTLPGAPEAHNASEVEERAGASTFKWRVAEVSGEDAFVMTAATRDEPGGFPWLVVLLLVLLLGGVGIWILRMRRRPSLAGPAPSRAVPPGTVPPGTVPPGREDS